ncbi:MAG: hypothetical protein GF419_03700 [Ignavibacteriales bacterium]|nr:hypothetical protein [Ignavibacteriales bacterium]
MKKIINILLLVAATLVPTAFGQDAVNVRLGVELIDETGESRRLKSNDEAKAGDGLRVYLLGEDAYNYYAVYADNTGAYLLNAGDNPLTPGSLTRLPANPNDYFEIDDASRTATVSLLVASEPIAQIEELFGEKQAVARFDWSLAEMKLEKRAKENVLNVSEKDFSLGGTERTRSSEQAAPIELKRFSGDGVTMKRYKIDILK